VGGIDEGRVYRGREEVVQGFDTGTVQTVRGGKIVRVRSYMDHNQALEAAGLRE
jgi:ketosteroid isomerase-like protein